MATNIWRGRWMAIAVLVVCLSALLFLSPGKAEADTLTYWEGSSGPSKLYEPGMACTEDSSKKHFEINAPGMWARSGYTNGQWVTYRVVLQSKSYYNSTWYNAVVTNWKSPKLAYPSSKASLGYTAIDLSQDGWTYPYRAYVQMRWYNYSNAVSGFTERRVDSYYNVGVGLQGGYCRV